MEDVTREEVIEAANESTLAAVRCSMKHWLYNANIEYYENCNTSNESCALCERSKGRHTMPNGMRCPLKDEEFVCCEEYRKVCHAPDINTTKQAANALYVRLAKIEYDLTHKEEKKPEEKKKEYYPLATIVSTSSPRLILNLPDCYLADDFRGHVFSIDEGGNLGQRHTKGAGIGDFYRNLEEEQIFPIKKQLT